MVVGVGSPGGVGVSVGVTVAFAGGDAGGGVVVVFTGGDAGVGVAVAFAGGSETAASGHVTFITAASLSLPVMGQTAGIPTGALASSALVGAP